MKFRELRRHLVNVHDIHNVSISCSKTLENRDTCDFHCSFSLDCFLEHSKSLHNNLFEKGANSVFDSSIGFNLLVSNTTGRIHTEVCQNAREKRRKEQMRMAKLKWSKKSKKRVTAATNAHAKVSAKGVTDTDELEVVIEPFLTTEPVEIVTENQQVAVIATTSDINDMQDLINQDLVSDDEDAIDNEDFMSQQDIDSDDDDIMEEDDSNHPMEEEPVEVITIDDSDNEGDAVKVEIDHIKDAVKLMEKENFKDVLVAIGLGNKKLGEKAVLKRVMAATTDISDMEHAMLLINWHLNKSKNKK
jgi:hypothetical protein